MRFRPEWFFAFVVLFLGCLFLAFPQSLWARPYVSLSGVVRDVCDHPLKGVTVRGWDGSRSFSAVTDDKGEYGFSELRPGVSLALGFELDDRFSARAEGLILPERGDLSVLCCYGSIGVGGVLAFRLPSNPSTGYGWTIRDRGDVSAFLPVGHSMEMGEEIAGGRPLTGAPGHEIWMFRALKEGKSVILLDYSRSWEADRAPERVAILVTVSENRF
ncbi:MAG: protease inhibitor I42 family protein [Synergistota bacterium]|nr:protease inhibitor I42 family protein [Synergistota bacterium]